MKKLLKIGLALALAVVMVIIGAQAVLADSNDAATHVNGVIKSISLTPAPKTVTITKEGGTDVVLQVPDTTVITKISVGPITINNLAVNDKVTATFITDGSGNKIASTITVTPTLVNKRAFEGTIKNIPTTGVPNTLVVTTKKGDETFKVNPGTEYQVPGIKVASVANFKVGDKVSVATVDVTLGTPAVTTHVALRMTLIPAKPVKVTGLLTAYTAATTTTAGSITVKDGKNVSTIFVVNGDTKIIGKKGTTVAVGNQVMVIGSHNLSGGPLVAKSIHVLKAKNTEHGQGNDNGNASNEHGKIELEHGNSQSQNGNQGNKNKD